MRKVLMISPYKGLVGGISRWTGHIIRYYNSFGKNDVFLEQYYGENEEKRQIHGNDSALKRIFLGISSYIPLIKGVKKRLKGEHFDVLHICSSASLGLIRDIILIIIAKKYSVKTIVHFRFGRIPQLLEKKGWESRALIKVIKSADSIIVLDKKSLMALQSKGYNNSIILPNVISEKLLNTINGNSKIQRANRSVLFVGHAIRTKGIFNLVEACKDIDDIELRIVGFTPDETKYEIEQITKNNGLMVYFVGELPYEETIKEMLAATVFSLPSYSEGFPNAILEAMVCGCPIVATEVGAIPEMLDVENGSTCGLCVKVNDIRALKESLSKMLDDREYALSCGENARKRAIDNYSIPIVWGKIVNIWNTI